MLNRQELQEQCLRELVRKLDEARAKDALPYVAGVLAEMAATYFTQQR